MIQRFKEKRCLNRCSQEGLQCYREFGHKENHYADPKENSYITENNENKLQ